MVFLHETACALLILCFSRVLCPPCESYLHLFLAFSFTVRKVYDAMILMDLEIKLIWQAKWDRGKVIFLLARYPAVLASLLELPGMHAPTVYIGYAREFKLTCP